VTNEGEWNWNVVCLGFVIRMEYVKAWDVMCCL